MFAADTVDPFVGRLTEIMLLHKELATVQGGCPRLVLVEGPAGIGKSALFERFLSDESELIVLRATGEQCEAFVAYALLDQLMRSVKIREPKLLASHTQPGSTA